VINAAKRENVAAVIQAMVPDATAVDLLDCSVDFIV
jgi:hypothetical protein|tara:strand:+ start:2744 stop:2851 length:108 start_codon:yes stop_codon:yes gene_type:complete